MMSALIEPFFYCLVLSFLWAPAVLFICARLSSPEKCRMRAPGVDQILWPAALLIAMLPAMAAPFAGALGISLRRAPVLPPMAPPAEATGPLVPAPGAIDPAGEAISLADMLWTGAVIYFYAFILLLALAILRHVWFAWRISRATPLETPALLAALSRWQSRMGLDRTPRYVLSTAVSSVCVFGFFRPVIILPDDLLARVSVEDAALMGAHEMAHIKRADMFLFLLCSAAKAIFWFNPFMHAICARTMLAAEQGADALVIARGVDRRQYARCFVQGLRLSAGASVADASALVPSFTPFDKRSRRARLDAILSGRAPGSTLTLKTKASLGVSAAFAAALAVAQAAIVVTPPEPKDALPVAPVIGQITLGYGKAAASLGADRPAHEGIDIKAARGAPVKAAGAGKVIEATSRYRDSEAWGNVVVIDHGHGLVTRYAHLDNYRVRKGDHVAAGDIIGAVGSTGRSTGPHLHFEVISDGVTIDPTPVVASVHSLQPQASPRPVTAPIPSAPAAPTELTAPAASPSDPADPDDAESPESAAGPSRERDEANASFEAKMEHLGERLREQFADLEPFHEFDEMTFAFEDMDFDLAVAFDEMRLSKSELEEVRREHEDALREAQSAIADARKEWAHAQEEARRAKREAQRELERRKKEWRKSARARAEARDHSQAGTEEEGLDFDFSFDEPMIDEEEMLEIKEREIRRAKAELERELADIAQRRKEIESEDD